MGYILTYEGKEKMLQSMNSGWLDWKFHENPKYLIILLRVVVVVAIICGIILVISLFTPR